LAEYNKFVTKKREQIHKWKKTDKRIGAKAAEEEEATTNAG